MTITPDYLIERKRMKGQLTKWKIAALILVIFLFFSYGNKLSNSEGISRSALAGGEHIASVRINEIIFEDHERTRKLEKIEKDKKIKGLIVNINSPGGSVVGSEILYNSLRKIAKEKPVVVVMESVAASGGYMAALGGDYIIAHNGTITGSIGVIMQSAEVTELAEKLGVKFENFKSDPLKAAPNPTEKLTPEVRQATMDTVYEVYDYFVGLVAARRNLDLEYTKKIADGRVYSGRQALDLKLIDAIGDEASAVQWLKDKHNVGDLEIVDVKLKRRERLIDVLMDDVQGRVSGIISGFKGMKSVW